MGKRKQTAKNNRNEEIVGGLKLSDCDSITSALRTLFDETTQNSYEEFATWHAEQRNVNPEPQHPIANNRANHTSNTTNTNNSKNSSSSSTTSNNHSGSSSSSSRNNRNNNDTISNDRCRRIDDANIIIQKIYDSDHQERLFALEHDLELLENLKDSAENTSKDASKLPTKSGFVNKNNLHNSLKHLHNSLKHPIAKGVIQNNDSLQHPKVALEENNHPKDNYNTPLKFTSKETSNYPKTVLRHDIQRSEQEENKTTRDSANTADILDQEAKRATAKFFREIYVDDLLDEHEAHIKREIEKEREKKRENLSWLNANQNLSWLNDTIKDPAAREATAKFFDSQATKATKKFFQTHPINDFLDSIERVKQLKEDIPQSIQNEILFHFEETQREEALYNTKKHQDEERDKVTKEDSFYNWLAQQFEDPNQRRFAEQQDLFSDPIKENKTQELFSDLEREVQGKRQKLKQDTDCVNHLKESVQRIEEEKIILTAKLQKEKTNHSKERKQLEKEIKLLEKEKKERQRIARKHKQALRNPEVKEIRKRGRIAAREKKEREEKEKKEKEKRERKEKRFAEGLSSESSDISSDSDFVLPNKPKGNPPFHISRKGLATYQKKKKAQQYSRDAWKRGTYLDVLLRLIRPQPQKQRTPSQLQSRTRDWQFIVSIYQILYRQVLKEKQIPQILQDHIYLTKFDFPSAYLQSARNFYSLIPSAYAIRDAGTTGRAELKASFTLEPKEYKDDIEDYIFRYRTRGVAFDITLSIEPHYRLGCEILVHTTTAFDRRITIISFEDPNINATKITEEEVGDEPEIS